MPINLPKHSKTNTMEKEPFLNQIELCKLLNIKRVCLWKHIKNGKIPYYQIGNKKLFKESEVNAALRVK